MTLVPRVPVTPTPAAYKYQVNDLRLALPAAYGTYTLQKSLYPYPPSDNWQQRDDPLVGHTVAPELCRDVIRYQGVPGVPGDFIAPTTPSAAARAAVGFQVGVAKPSVNVIITELAAPLGDRLLDQRRPTPPDCAKIQVDGRPSASVLERPLPGFGVRSRYIIRTYPLGGKPWTERTIQYRTATYAVLIRLDAYDQSESAFLAFARQTRDRLTAQLKG